MGYLNNTVELAYHADYVCFERGTVRSFGSPAKGAFAARIKKIFTNLFTKSSLFSDETERRIRCNRIWEEMIADVLVALIGRNKFRYKFPDCAAAIDRGYRNELEDETDGLIKALSCDHAKAIICDISSFEGICNGAMEVHIEDDKGDLVGKIRVLRDHLGIEIVPVSTLTATQIAAEVKNTISQYDLVNITTDPLVKEVFEYS